ncbi:unnamed protein product [Schistosoma mattheei]|uniref:Uncharacterized protein n=1 Tax=Schistosoma mattheei TaxID=31246 RepID=A0A183NRV4_9TREM|nr:unnamed protein product [Schistosoma mattheei]
MVRGSQQETLDLGFVLLGTRQQGVPVILRELMLPDELDPISCSSTVRDGTTELPQLQLTSCRSEMYLQLIDHWMVINVMYIKSFLVQIESCPVDYLQPPSHLNIVHIMLSHLD